MAKIEMGKKYKTRNGLSVRILCVDRSNKHLPLPVVALVQHTSGMGCMEYVETYTETGYHNAGCIESSYDLIEVSPWDDFKIDDPVMVRDYSSGTWARRYFSGVVDGKPSTFCGGCTSWNNGTAGYVIWDECRRPTPEELKN